MKHNKKLQMKAYHPGTNIIALESISFDIPKNQLTGIIGPVGSGKSSFLALLLNELEIKTGKIPKFTKFGYASQEPWIITGTIRDNIIMKRHFDEERYREILRVTCLEADLLKFPAGDMAYIGDRGITLSGGQKARVGLARAIYEEADIYLLDDPLGQVKIQTRNL